MTTPAIDDSVTLGYCVVCHDPMPPVDPTEPIVQLGEDADTFVRMCGDCMADYLEWRERDMARAKLS